MFDLILSAVLTTAELRNLEKIVADHQGQFAKVDSKKSVSTNDCICSGSCMGSDCTGHCIGTCKGQGPSTSR